MLWKGKFFVYSRGRPPGDILHNIKIPVGRPLIANENECQQTVYDEIKRQEDDEHPGGEDRMFGYGLFHLYFHPKMRHCQYIKHGPDDIADNDQDQKEWKRCAARLNAFRILGRNPCFPVPGVPCTEMRTAPGNIQKYDKDQCREKKQDHVPETHQGKKTHRIITFPKIESNFSPQSHSLRRTKAAMATERVHREKIINN